MCFSDLGAEPAGGNTAGGMISDLGGPFWEPSGSLFFGRMRGPPGCYLLSTGAVTLGVTFCD